MLLAKNDGFCCIIGISIHIKSRLQSNHLLKKFHSHQLMVSSSQNVLFACIPTNVFPFWNAYLLLDSCALKTEEFRYVIEVTWFGFSSHVSFTNSFPPLSSTALIIRWPPAWFNMNNWLQALLTLLNLFSFIAAVVQLNDAFCNNTTADIRRKQLLFESLAMSVCSRAISPTQQVSQV